MKEQILKCMREAGKPLSAGDVTKALGADRKEVNKAFCRTEERRCYRTTRTLQMGSCKIINLLFPSSDGALFENNCNNGHICSNQLQEKVTPYILNGTIRTLSCFFYLQSKETIKYII